MKMLSFMFVSGFESLEDKAMQDPWDIQII